jgi:intraflagellar transport protein 88
MLIADTALDKAADARKRERALKRAREQAGAADAHAPELGFAVELALACCYEAAGLHVEAQELYGSLIKSQAVPQLSSRCVHLGLKGWLYLIPRV